MVNLNGDDGNKNRNQKTLAIKIGQLREQAAVDDLLRISGQHGKAGKRKQHRNERFFLVMFAKIICNTQAGVQ